MDEKDFVSPLSSKDLEFSAIQSSAENEHHQYVNSTQRQGGTWNIVMSTVGSMVL